MKLIEIKQEEDKVKVYVKQNKLNIPKDTENAPEVYGIYEEIFNTKEQAQKHYTSIKENNEKGIKDFGERLKQMPLDALEKVNEFANEIKDLMFDEEGNIKKKLQHNKKLKEINELIISYKNVENMKYNIKKYKEFNDEIDKILDKLK